MIYLVTYIERDCCRAAIIAEYARYIRRVEAHFLAAAASKCQRLFLVIAANLPLTEAPPSRDSDEKCRTYHCRLRSLHEKCDIWAKPRACDKNASIYSTGRRRLMMMIARQQKAVAACRQTSLIYELLTPFT